MAIPCAGTLAADPWHLPGWRARAVVDVTQLAADPDVDTAAVKVLCQGLARADGTDYRVVDAAGKPVPFQLTFHDAARYSLVAFRATAKGRFLIYFGKPDAPRVPEQVSVDPAPGAGPPKGSWVPRHGLVLETWQRPEGDNPKTVADLARLLAASARKHGARYQRRVADGYNPFGSSENYLSLYRGWIRIPKAGTYAFCTASNEASFSFLDGKELIHWPGHHTVERGLRGEKNAAVELTEGLHYLEYYHEEVSLEQMAFLGWRPVGDAGTFALIPESVFTAPHTAAVVAYETPTGPLARFEPLITDSAWPSDRHEGQYTRVRFAAMRAPGPPDATAYQWDFGDGVGATGAEAEHLYLALGRYEVTLKSRGPGGDKEARWPLEVFEIEHVTEEFKEGRPRDYARLVREYDREKLDAANLKELAFLLAESEEPAQALEAGRVFVRRFGAAQPKWTPGVRRLLASCAIRLGKDGLEEAVANYQASLTADTPATERFDVLARLVRLLAVERGLPERAAPVVGQIEEAWKAAKPDEETRAAYRRAVIATGDALLWHGKVDGAIDLYRRAEGLGAFVPSQVRAARLGAYPGAVREFIAGNNLGAALDLVDRWEETFPTEKVRGQTLFWRGKLLHLRGQHHEAARHLARGVVLATGAVFETEGRWLLAAALEASGRGDDAKRELARLVTSGVNDEFTRQAREKLQGGKK